jgi:hypothetical protein
MECHEEHAGWECGYGEDEDAVCSVLIVAWPWPWTITQRIGGHRDADISKTDYHGRDHIVWNCGIGDA